MKLRSLVRDTTTAHGVSNIYFHPIANGWKLEDQQEQINYYILHFAFLAVFSVACVDTSFALIEMLPNKAYL